MPGTTILGSGRYVPGAPVSSDALSRVMETSGAWVLQRTGIAERHYAPDGVGVSDLAVPACEKALGAAGLAPSDVDYILFNTMTPDYGFPGSGVLLGHKLGIPGVPALDIRQQCAAIPFSLQVADGLLSTGAARTVLLVGAEAHAGFMPWRDWTLLESPNGGTADPDDYAHATEHRGMAVVFGDGAGALVLGRAAGTAGLLGVAVHSDGSSFDAIRLEAGGFRRRPYLNEGDLKRDAHIPRMRGREVFRHAVQKLPAVVREVCARHDVSLDAIDWFLAHQANDRINAAVREALGVPESRMPSNIARYGNTSSATIPILVDELFHAGQLRSGQLLCFLALGAGLNWGAALMRL